MLASLHSCTVDSQKPNFLENFPVPSVQIYEFAEERKREKDRSVVPHSKNQNRVLFGIEGNSA